MSDAFTQTPHGPYDPSLPWNDPPSDSLFVKVAEDACKCTVCGEVVANSTEARDAHLNGRECHV